jgi:hypothetical protein
VRRGPGGGQQAQDAEAGGQQAAGRGSGLRPPAEPAAGPARYCAPPPALCHLGLGHSALPDSVNPTSLAYRWTDGSPRVVPIWFHWTGDQFVLATPPRAPKLKALAADARVALNGHPVFPRLARRAPAATRSGAVASPLIQLFFCDAWRRSGYFPHSQAAAGREQ